jgi:polar amino acid transport system substrate-binding protein
MSIRSTAEAPPRTARRVALVAVAAALAASIVSACSTSYTPTALPTKTTVAPTPPPATTPTVCTNATQSYAPTTLEAAAGDSAIKAIRARGYLRVGVSADTYLFGARNPFTRAIEGFDIDMAKAVAGEILGDPTKTQLVVITAADRIPALQEGRVDIVARNMTMTCDRWEKIAFSSEYYRAGQKVLVTKGSTAVTLDDLKGKRVCAPAGSTSLEKLRTYAGVVAVESANHTGCLVLLQQGKADAITGDDTVLAGLAAQDPYAVVTSAAAMTSEPYGLGFKADAVGLVRVVNGLLDRMRADGRWTQIYNRWLAGPLGKAPQPPTAVYGR